MTDVFIPVYRVLLLLLLLLFVVEECRKVQLAPFYLTALLTE